MTAERNPTKFSFELVKKSAVEIMLRDGSHLPLMIAQGSNRAVVGFPDQLPSTAEGRLRWMWKSGFEISADQQIGKLEEIFFVGEGWMNEAKEGKLPEISPANDPQRKEILMISSQKVNSKVANMAIYEMVRDGNGDLTDLVGIEFDSEKADRGENRLLAAFLLGYGEGISSQNAKIN